MEEDNCAQTALDVMADMLKERGYDYSYAPELEGTSLIYRDKAGNYHDCWGAGSSELVNVPITVTPEQALSVDDLNGIIDENAKLRERIAELEELLPDNGRWFSADTVEAYVAENDGLRQFASGMYGMLKAIDKVFGNHDLCETTRPLIFEEEKSFKDVATELGIEVPDGS